MNNSESGSPASGRAKNGTGLKMSTVLGWLDKWEDAAFVLVAVFLLLAAMVMLGHSVAGVKHLSTASIFLFVHDLLFVMIILEILGTVLAYLRDRRISIRPFLFIGVIFAIRKILMVGAKLTAGPENGHAATPPDAPAIALAAGPQPWYHDMFLREMVEMGVGAVIVLLLVFAYYILARVQTPNEDCIGCLGRRKVQ